jgi:hypothetical protein
MSEPHKEKQRTPLHRRLVERLSARRGTMWLALASVLGVVGVGAVLTALHEAAEADEDAAFDDVAPELADESWSSEALIGAEAEDDWTEAWNADGELEREEPWVLERR